MTQYENEELEKTFRFLNTELSEQRKTLFDDARGLDTKAALIAGFSVTAVSLLLGRGSGSIGWWAIATYVGALVLAMAVLWPRRWYALEPSELQAELADKAAVDVIGMVAGTKVSIYERNHAIAQRKAVLWTASVVLLSAGLGLSIWSVKEDRTYGNTRTQQTSSSHSKPSGSSGDCYPKTEAKNGSK